MSDLCVRLGEDARTAMCRAFDRASSSIDAEFYSIGDPAVVASLNRAADRGVHVRVVLEGDTHRYRGQRAKEPSDARVRGDLGIAIDVIVSRMPRALVHGKAAVVDDKVALIDTANPTVSGFAAAGEVLVEHADLHSAQAVEDKIEAAAEGAEPASTLRHRLYELFRSPADLRIAAEDLSDRMVCAWLLHRVQRGYHDRVLVSGHPSKSSASLLERLAADGVSVRTLRGGYMHEKYVDAGDCIYVGSANLTGNGIDEAHEVGVVASAADFGTGTAVLRRGFERMWSAAQTL